MYSNHDLFLDHCKNRLEQIYEELKAEGKEPIVAFRKAPDVARKELEIMVEKFNDTWDSDWK